MSTGVKIALVAGGLFIAYRLFSGSSTVSSLTGPLGTPTGLPLSPSPGAPTPPPPLTRSQAASNLVTGAESAAVQSSLFVVTGGLSSSTVRNAVGSVASRVGSAIKSGASSVYHDLGAIF